LGPSAVAGWRRAACGLVVVLAAVLAAPVGPAHARVTPASGGPRSTFVIAFPAAAVVLDLQLTAPRRCRGLDGLRIAIRHARTGRFRFGPRVPGARPRRDGTRLRRWCRGRYHVAVVSTGEFEPSPTDEFATGRFAVR
jgi:hypothetical protein